MHAHRSLSALRAPLTGAAILTVAVATVAALMLPAASADPTTPAADPFASDTNGYLDSAARCDGAQTTVAFGRTARALVAICVNREGDLEYRGVRLSDEASTTMPAGRSADGTIVAANGGVTYAVSPTMLLVSEGDAVLYRDAWVEFREPRFSDSTPASSSTAPSSPAPSSTVSTTTVTIVPTNRQGG